MFRNITALKRNILQRVARLKNEIIALYFAARDQRTPWLARLLVAAIVAYALSPIDLIPDFIPVIGFLDDVILLPLAIGLALRMVPETVMLECRLKATSLAGGDRPVSWLAASIVVIVWLVVAWLCWRAFFG